MLTVSAFLFTIYGVLAIGVGIFVPFAIRSSGGGVGLFHPRPDRILFGEQIQRFVAGRIRNLTIMLWDWLAGMLVSFGVLQVAVTWFAMHAGQRWALWSLAVADLAMAPPWYLILRRYERAGARPHLGETPPLLWVPAISIPAAALLGFLALY